MRIGIFTDTYLPDINGVVSSIETLRKGLIEQGHEVFVVANHKSIFKMKFEDNILLLPGLELKMFDYKKLSSPIQNTAWNYVRQMRLDLIHVQQEFGVGLFARWVAKRLNIPLVYTYHTQYEDYTHYLNIFKSDGFDKQTKRLVGWLSKELAQPAQMIIVPSDKTKQLLERYGVTKPIMVIPTGIDLRRFEPSLELSKRRQEIREKYQITDDQSLFIFIGRISDEKGISIVLKGFEVLLKQRDDCKFMIVGGGPELENYQQWIKERNLEDKIITTGMIVNTEIAGYYHAADIFVSASLSETQGMTFMEAMACGLPLLASDREILSELLVEDKSGYYFSGTEEFIEVANHYLNLDETAKESLKQGALELVKPYDDRIFVDSVLDCYRQALVLHSPEYVIKNIEGINSYYQIDIENHDYKKSIYMTAQKLAQEDIIIDQIIEWDRLEKWMQQDTIEKLYSKAIGKLLHRDYSETAIREYLATDESDDDAIEIVMTKLKEANFINDERFLEERIDSMKRQNIGIYKSKQRLEKLQFKPEDIEKGLAELGLIQEELCFNLLTNVSKKYQNLPIVGQKQKLIQKAQREGFELATAYAALNRIELYEDRNQIYHNLYKEISKYYQRQIKKHNEYETRNKTIARMNRKGYAMELILEILEEVKKNED